MQLLSKNKLSLSLALAVCLCAPISGYAANSGGTFDPIYGEYIGNKGPNNNVVTIDSVTEQGIDIQSRVCGGLAVTTESSSGNSVTIDVGTQTLNALVYGGESRDSYANGNKVSVVSGTITGFILGGSGARANNNVVSITSVNMTRNGSSIAGGDSISNSSLDTADNNEVIINGGTFNETTVYGGKGINASTNSNKVTINNITIGSVYGGYSDMNSSTGNIVFITDSKLIGSVYGGSSDNVAANQNIVTIKNGEISDNVSGGAGKNAANGNSIHISGNSNVGGDVIGGFVNDTSVQAVNNTVTIEGNPTFASSSSLYGGKNTQVGSGDIITGNRLNIYTSGVSVKSVENFQYYDLALDKNTTLTVADSLIMKSGDHITSTRALSEFNVGDTVTVIESTSGTVNIMDATRDYPGIAEQGILYKYGYEYVLDIGTNTLIATITSKEKNRQSMSVADGQLAAMGMLRSGADMVAGSAMNNAAKSETEYDVFGALNYTNISMDSVSSVDVQGSSMLVGMGRNIKHSNSNTTLGAFLEAGWGTYESSTGLAHANGHTNYYGIGVLARNNNDNGVYTEGSIRVGKVGNTYSGRTVADGSYDVSSTYYGAHIGIGKINKINEKTSTDIYAKYFYAHEGGTSATIVTDKFEFDSIDSHRVRIGGRLNSLNKNINRYVGLAYEYEFGGKANATAYGIDIASPTAKGSSGILELGLVYKPAPDSKFSMDMGVNGYAGKRKGVTGNVTLNWGF